MKDFGSIMIVMALLIAGVFLGALIGYLVGDVAMGCTGASDLIGVWAGSLLGLAGYLVGVECLKDEVECE